MGGLFFHPLFPELCSVQPPLQCWYRDRNYKQARDDKSAQDLRWALHVVLCKRFRHPSMELLPVEGSRTRHQKLPVLDLEIIIPFLCLLFLFLNYFMRMSICLHADMWVTCTQHPRRAEEMLDALHLEDWVMVSCLGSAGNWTPVLGKSSQLNSWASSPGPCFNFLLR